MSRSNAARRNARRCGRGETMKQVLSALAATSLCILSGSALADGDASHGKALYGIYCTQCHGLQGNGHGVNVRDMAVLPRNHTDRGEMSARTDEDLFKAIQGGGKAVNKSVLMPSWGNNLSESDIRDLVAYLRELCCKDSQ
jgi:cytochrome c oxidase cbb3-type subunit 3